MHKQMFENTIDTCERVFYTYPQVNTKDPSNHANGVSAPLIRTGLHKVINAELRSLALLHIRLFKVK